MATKINDNPDTNLFTAKRMRVASHGSTSPDPRLVECRSMIEDAIRSTAARGLRCVTFADNVFDGYDDLVLHTMRSDLQDRGFVLSGISPVLKVAW